MKGRTALDMAGALGRHLVGMMAGLVTVGLVARRLGAPGLGAWALLGVTGFLVGLSDLGLSISIGRSHTSGDPVGAERATERALLVALLLSPWVGAAAVGWTVGELGEQAGTPARLRGCGALVLAGGVAGAVAMPLRALLSVRGGLLMQSWARALGAGVQMAVVAIGFLLVDALEVPAAAFALGAALELVVLAAATRRLAPGVRLWPGLARLRGLRGALSHGMAATVINVAVVLSLRIDTAVLAAVASLPVIAAYGVAARAVDQVFGLVKQVSPALQPRMATRRGRAEALRLGSWLIPPTVTAGCAALWFAGEPLLRLWVGEVVSVAGFRAALGTLAAAAVLAAFSEVASGWLALAAPSAWSAARTIGAGCAVNLLVSVGGREVGGVWAVAGGTLLGNAVAATMAWREATRLAGWDARQLREAVLPTLAALAGAWLIGPAAGRLAAQGPVASVVGAALVGGASLLAAGVTVGWIVRTQRETACASGS